MELSNLVSLVKDAGVVGAGGAGFPTHKKLNNRCEMVIVNGAECEPLLQVDQQLMFYEAAKLVETLKTIVLATGARKGIIALKKKYHEAIETLQIAVAGNDNIELFLLEDFYPAGDEQVLVYEASGRVVPPGGIPIEVGAIVLNVETILNIARALEKQAVTAKYVTITGAVANPVTVRVPVGTPLSILLKLAGNPTIKDFRVLEGGPMMGKLVNDLNQGVTKTTKGLVVIPGSHRLLKTKQPNTNIALKRAMAVCCQCSACTDLCPRYLLGHSLEPHRIIRNLSHNITHDFAGIITAQLCSECGVCDHYACAMDISPRILNAAVKQELAKHKYSLPKAEEVQTHPQRELRKIPVNRLLLRLGLKDYSKKAPLITEQIDLDQVRLPLKQHIGAPCYPVVKPGDKVKEGQVVAKVPDGNLGSVIHASISGTIRQISPEIVIER